MANRTRANRTRANVSRAYRSRANRRKKNTKAKRRKYGGRPPTQSSRAQQPLFAPEAESQDSEWGKADCCMTVALPERAKECLQYGLDAMNSKSWKAAYQWISEGLELENSRRSENGQKLAAADAEIRAATHEITDITLYPWWLKVGVWVTVRESAMIPISGVLGARSPKRTAELYNDKTGYVVDDDVEEVDHSVQLRIPGLREEGELSDPIHVRALHRASREDVARALGRNIPAHE